MSAMMGRINQFREAVRAGIAAALPELRAVESQLGRFDLDRLLTSSLPVPSVQVGILKAPLDARADDSSSAMCAMAAFVLTGGRHRDDEGWAVAEALAVLLRRNQMWGLTQVGVPEAIRIAPVVSADVRKRGTAIVAVEWTQALHAIGPSLAGQDGVWRLGLTILGEDVAIEAPAP